MNLFEVLMNCLYLLGITILVYIIVHLWLDLWMKIRLRRRMIKGHEFVVSNAEDLQKAFEYIEEEVKKNETRRN